MNPLYETVARRAENVCEYCRAPESVFNFLFDVDHFVPLSKGGTNDLENLVLACRACNAYKSASEFGLSESGENARLFNPRRDVWAEHFRVRPETFEIESLTEIGRGTINRLRLNNPVQLKARLLWNEFKVFP